MYMFILRNMGAHIQNCAMRLPDKYMQRKKFVDFSLTHTIPGKLNTDADN